MTATAKTARTQTVYYIVVNGEQVAEAKRRPAADAKFAETVASDTTNHITLVTGTGKVLDERPAVEAETETETVNIPGLGEVSKAGVDALAALKVETADEDKDPIALLADALESGEDEGDDATPAGFAPDGLDAPQDDAPAATDESATQAIAQAVAVINEAPKAEPKPAKKTATAPVKAETSYDRMIAVFAKAVEDKQMGSGSLAGYKAGVRAVLKAQTTGMDTDLTKVDVEMAITVFETKTPGILSQTSKTYIADFRRAVTLYNLYLADPTNFKFPAKNVRATRLVPTAAPVAQAAPVAKKTAAKPTAPKTSKKGKK